jgi:hypothetical protein
MPEQLFPRDLILRSYFPSYACIGTIEHKRPRCLAVLARRARVMQKPRPKSERLTNGFCRVQRSGLLAWPRAALGVPGAARRGSACIKAVSCPELASVLKGRLAPVRAGDRGVRVLLLTAVHAELVRIATCQIEGSRDVYRQTCAPSSAPTGAGGFG